jgi:hypothetical protein
MGFLLLRKRLIAQVLIDVSGRAQMRVSLEENGYVV